MSLYKKFRNKFNKTGLVILTLSLTFLSLKAQFHFWNGLFGLETAYIASAVFEILRLASLFIMLKWIGYKKVIGIILYVNIAFFCGAVAVTSWYSEIIEEHAKQVQLEKSEYQKRIDTIKSKYAALTNEKLVKFERDIYYIDSKIAANPNSTYWQIRKSQITITKEDLINELDNFLTENPENPERWIQKNSAKLNLYVEPVNYSKTSYTVIEKAISNIWNKTPEEARKFVSMVFVIVIEIGIILLAIMTNDDNINDFNDEVDKNLVIVDNRIDKNFSVYTDILNYIEMRFNHNDVKDLFQHSADEILNNGKLPKSSQLTMKLRPIRKELINLKLNQGFLLDLYNHYCDA